MYTLTLSREDRKDFDSVAGTNVTSEDRITDSRYWLQALTKATSDLKDALKNTSQTTYPIQTSQPTWIS